ncbi:hypothetical protein V2J09_021366 [Rumex salicifolius]
MRRPKATRNSRKQFRLLESEEIDLLEEWIESGKPDRGSNPLSFPPLPANSPIGRLRDGSFSTYAGCDLFSQLPLSKKTKDGLKHAKYTVMTDIQRASLPHSLCGRDILGAAKTGSGKTLAFVIPVLEKLHQARWGPEDGVGSIILSPTRELAGQLFDVLKKVGRYHGFSAGLLIGGRKGVGEEKERVNGLNILVCTPGRLLQHMNETPNFECSQLQTLVLDEADRILDEGFKKDVNAIVDQLPKCRQTFLFSATQTKSVKDLARLSLKDPEYLCVHEEAKTATPEGLVENAMIVPLDEKLDMLWSFIKSHTNSKILVKFVFEAFRKLAPGIPLKLLHGKMNQEQRLGTYSKFSAKRSVLFSTDVSARGLDFDQAVDWVVQVDCPSNAKTYIHRVGRTARYNTGGKALLFLEPSEMKMFEKIQEAKAPIKLIKASKKHLQPVSPMLGALLVKYPEMQQLAQRAFTTYLRSVSNESDKEVFDVTKLAVDEFSASLGLPMTPKIRFLKRKRANKNTATLTSLEVDNSGPLDLLGTSTANGNGFKEDESDNDLLRDDVMFVGEQDITENETVVPATRAPKKKKLKINLHRPVGSRTVFDDEGNTIQPLATIAETISGNGLPQLDVDKVNERYKKIREQMKEADKIDKDQARQLRKEKQMQKKIKLKNAREEAESDEDESSGCDEEPSKSRVNRKTKLYLSDDEDTQNKNSNKRGELNISSISLAEQESMALKLLESMNK